MLIKRAYWGAWFSIDGDLEGGTVDRELACRMKDAAARTRNKATARARVAAGQPALRARTHISPGSALHVAECGLQACMCLVAWCLACGGEMVCGAGRSAWKQRVLYGIFGMMNGVLICINSLNGGCSGSCAAVQRFPRDVQPQLLAAPVSLQKR